MYFAKLVFFFTCFFKYLCTYISPACKFVNTFFINYDQLYKDGAYYCYCAYVLRILGYSGFLWVVPTNTGIYLRGLKLCGESRT